MSFLLLELRSAADPGGVLGDLAWVAALVLVSGLVATAASWAFFAGFAPRCARRAIAAGTPGHALHAYSMAGGVVFGMAGMLIFGLAFQATDPSEPSLRTLAFLGGWLTVWSVYRGYSAGLRRILRATHGPDWDHPGQFQLAALMMGPLLGGPIGAALLALPFHAWADASGTPFPGWIAAGFIYPGLVLSGFYFRAVAGRMLSEPRPLPDEIAERLEAAIGSAPTQQTAVFGTGGGAFYNALAIQGIPGAQMWISEPLVDLLTPEEAAAVLVHEWDHVEQRDDRRRIWTTMALHGVFLAAVSVPWTVDLYTSSAAFVLAFLLASTFFGQRIELRADARAKAAGLGEAMGSALVKLYRVNQIPRSTSADSLATHPMLAARLEALGLEVPEAAPEEAPVPAGPSMKKVFLWTFALAFVLALSNVVLSRLV